MNEQLESRLRNWKFSSAMNYVKGEGEKTERIVYVLASLFGNVGYMDSDLGVLVETALESIGIKNEE
jgi:hypothetical protein